MIKLVIFVDLERKNEFHGSIARYNLYDIIFHICKKIPHVVESEMALKL